MTRGRALALVAALVISMLAFLNFDWYAISMSPNGKVTNLDNFTGAMAHPSVQALCVLLILELALVAISSGRLARGFGISIALTALGATLAGAIGFFGRDLSALHTRINNLTNIAAAHDVTAIDTTANLNGWLFLAAGSLLTLFAAYWVVGLKVWAPKASKPATSGTPFSEPEIEATDSISLWESQRKKD
jgi:hypothetical protein